MSEDWLNDEPPREVVATTELPADPRARLELLEGCLSRLKPHQRAFLLAFRENGLNVRKASRALQGDDNLRSSHGLWLRTIPDYNMVVRIWQATAGAEALDKDRLLARQDDIVETLLTPKPVLYQGFPVRDPRDPSGTAILEEVDAGAAGRQNEVLMKAAGLLKDKEVDVNIGLVGPTLSIQVVSPTGEVRDITPRGVEIALPEPAAEEDWLA